MALGFKIIADNNLAQNSLSEAGGFHDEQLQYHLLPYFKFNNKCIDPYDGAEFQGEELSLLRDKLTEAITQIREKPPL